MLIFVQSIALNKGWLDINSLFVNFDSSNFPSLSNLSFAYESAKADKNLNWKKYICSNSSSSGFPLNINLIYKNY